MPRFILNRAIFVLIRFFAIGLALLVLVEISFCVFGGSERHVWEFDSYSRMIPKGMAHDGETWVAVFFHASVASSLVVTIAFGAIIMIGYGWGILGARLRKVRLIHLLTLPFTLLSNIPGFWFITMLVAFTVLHWNRPGYSDDLSITRGFDYLTLWHATMLAIPIASGLLAWQLRAVSHEICEKASEPYVRALFIRGHRSETIFYRNIFKHSLSGLIGLFDKTLSPLLGALVIVEWAYHYDGVGTLLVESAQASRYEGIFFVGMMMAALMLVVMFVREVAERFFGKELF